MLDYKIHDDNNSLYDSPPCYGIYMCELLFEDLLAQGGLGEGEFIKEAANMNMVQLTHGRTPAAITQVIPSTVGIPPHSTYAITQGGAHVGATEPQPQGTIPPAPQCLAPIPEDREFSGPYTERDSESSDDEVAPRRRRAGKEPMADGNQRPRNIRGVNPQKVQERINADEAEIQRLKRDLEAHQAPRLPLPPRGRNPPPIIDLDGPSQRRAVVPRADPSNLLPLGDPDDPTPSFTEEIMNAHISRKFKIPTIKAYDGAGDPDNHIRTFSNALLLQPVNDAIKCQAFPQTLSSMAQRWYSRLPPNSIGSFRELSQAFIKQFISGRVHERSSASLMSIMPGAKESLRVYLNHFTKEALKVPDLDDKLQDRVGKYIKAEESMRKTVVSNEPAGGKKQKTNLEYITKDKYPRTEQSNDSTLKMGGPGQKFTELNKYTGDGGDRSNNVRKKFDDRKRDQDDQGRNPQPRGPVINTIFGGPTAAGLSKNSRKAYTREVMHIVGEAPKRARTRVTMAFDDSDLEGVKFPHDDPLVIIPIIGNSSVKRVLVDNGASVDILLHDTFLRIV
ncbi:hypothetical protein AgCh_000334 [Apium graveolens]